MDIPVHERRMSGLYRFPFAFNSYDYRATCLFFGCLTYALFGSPTPDVLSFAEVVIFVLLILSIGIGRVHDVLISGRIVQSDRVRLWKIFGRFAVLYGLSVPMLVGVVNGHNVYGLARDVIPFLFLFLPLFLFPLIRARPHYFRSVLFAVLLIGMMFAFRSLVMRFVDGCAVWCVDELLYLENMPTVLFTALFLIGSGLSVMMRGVNCYNISFFVFCVIFSLVPLVAMVLTLQRASLGAVVLYIILMMVFFFYKRPVRAVGVVVLFGLVIAYLGISFYEFYLPFWDKTQKVGLNMRAEEFQAVWNVVTRDPFTFLFGLGWGGQFHSPAVGGLRVNFTHNFFSSLVLKTGIVGALLCCLYVFGVLERLSRLIFINKPLGLALAAPILIDLSLYASFKSLDFGLMLLLIVSSLIYFRRSEFSNIS